MPSPLSARSIWLGYHEITAADPRGDVPRTASLYHVRRDTFSHHLDLIRASGLPVLTASESLAATTDHVVITFDDGWRGSLSVGVECLVAAGMRATFFVTRDFVGTRWFADRELLLAASQAGMEFGTHGCSHRLLAVSDERLVETELTDSKRYLEDLLARSIDTGSAPGGNWTGTLGRIAHGSGYSCFATSYPGINRPGDDRFQLRRLILKASTDLTTIARWLRFSIARDQLRQYAFDVVRRILGAQGYARLRRRLLGTRPTDDILLIDR